MENYDLISAIIIRINDKMKNDDATVQLLQILCSRRTGKQQQLAALQKSGISTNEAVERGIGYMCNLSESIFQDGQRKGIDIGAVRSDIKTVCRMLSLKKNIEEIMGDVGVEQSFVEAVIRVANGDFSTDDANIDRIYEAIYNATDTQNESAPSGKLSNHEGFFFVPTWSGTCEKYAKIGIRRKIRHMSQTRDFLRIRVFHMPFTKMPLMNVRGGSPKSQYSGKPGLIPSCAGIPGHPSSPSAYPFHDVKNFPSPGDVAQKSCTSPILNEENKEGELCEKKEVNT